MSLRRINGNQRTQLQQVVIAEVLQVTWISLHMLAFSNFTMRSTAETSMVGHSQGHTGDLALHCWDHLGHSLDSTGG